ncbi:MAG: adenine deaminase [Chloroflexi bacterium]|nr:adenine deaminase [Chloroflexota bacterium]
MFFLEPSVDDVKDLINVSRGSEPADTYIRGGTVANVYSGEYLRANVAIKKGRIAYVGLSEKAIGDATEMIDASGKYLCPGYFEAHAHPFAIYNPAAFCEAMLQRGTTTTYFDTLSFLLILGNGSFERSLLDVSKLPIKVLWGIRIAPQSVMADHDIDIKFGTDRVKQILELPNVAGVFEVTRWPALLEGDNGLLESVAAARQQGKRVDGHTAGCSYEKLNGVVAAGLESCHEAIDLEQALDRLRLGMYVFLRGSSIRDDLPELLRAVTQNKVNTSRLILTTDGSSPWYYVERGSVECLADTAVDEGVDPMTALQMITLNPATYFHLDQYVGGIAPGRFADIVINPRPDRFKPETVMVNGQVVGRNGRLEIDLSHADWGQYHADHPSLPRGVRIRPEDVMVRAEDAIPDFPVMDLPSTAITRRLDMKLPVANGFVDLSHSDGGLFATLLERHGKWATNGIIRGFARNLDGLAVSYNTAGQVMVIGASGEAMAMAANRLYDIGGGIILVEDGRVLFEMPLALGGMMSYESMDIVGSQTQEFKRLLRDRGHAYEDVLSTILFLPCDFLPELRVNPAGVYDVKRREMLRPRRIIN